MAARVTKLADDDSAYLRIRRVEFQQRLRLGTEKHGERSVRRIDRIVTLERQEPERIAARQCGVRLRTLGRWNVDG